MLDRPGRRDRLLMFSPVMPSDHGNGLAMRAGFFLDAYARRFEVDLVVAPVAGSGKTTEFARSRTRRIETLSVDRPDSHYALASSVLDPMARVEALRRYGRPSLAAFIGPLSRSLGFLAPGLLADGDRHAAVHVFRLYLAELATSWFEMSSDRPRMIMDCDENDVRAYRRLADMERRRRDPVAAALAAAQADAFAPFAAAWLPKFDLVLAASDREARSLSEFGVSAAIVPNVVADVPAKPPRRRQRICSILFVGSLGYAPNVEAVSWFVSRVWRRLERALRHRVRLVIVGGNPPPALLRLGSQSGIKITGAVSDLASYYRESDLVIAPLRAGGGTRIKVIEAAAYGVPVVATRFAVEGTTFQGKVDMLLADNETTFLRACLLLARDRTFAAQLAARARAKVKRDYAAGYWRARAAELAADCSESCDSAS